MHPGLSDFVYCFGVEYMGDSTEDDEETYGGGEHRSAELKTSLWVRSWDMKPKLIIFCFNL